MWYWDFRESGQVRDLGTAGFVVKIVAYGDNAGARSDVERPDLSLDLDGEPGRY